MVLEKGWGKSFYQNHAQIRAFIRSNEDLINSREKTQRAQLITVGCINTGSSNLDIGNNSKRMVVVEFIGRREGRGESRGREESWFW